MYENSLNICRIDLQWCALSNLLYTKYETAGSLDKLYQLILCHHLNVPTLSMTMNSYSPCEPKLQCLIQTLSKN